MPLPVHKSIYRHMLLWLKIDLEKGVQEGDYGTLNSNAPSGAQIDLQTHATVAGN